MTTPRRDLVGGADVGLATVGGGPAADVALSGGQATGRGTAAGSLQQFTGLVGQAASQAAVQAVVGLTNKVTASSVIAGGSAARARLATGAKVVRVAAAQTSFR